MKEATLHRVERHTLGVTLAVTVIIAEMAGIWRSLDPLLAAWSQPEYSHAWLIPPLAMLIFLHRFAAVKFAGARVPGVFIATLSIAVMVFGWAAGSYTAILYGAIVGLIGFVWSIVGADGMKTLATPLIYLFFMVPIPLAFYVSISAQMQLWSSELGIVLVRLLALPGSLDGNIIVLPSARLEVAEACSGLRYLFPLVSFAFLVAMLLEDRVWKKALIVASSFPIAIVTNAVRIAMIAFLLERFGIDTTSGTIHAFEGFAVFALCMLLLFFEVWLLLRIGTRGGRFTAADLVTFERGGFQRLLAWPTRRTALLSAAILIAGTTLVASLPARDETPIRRPPFALFPMEFGEWHGVPKTLDRESLDALGLTDYLLADYRGETHSDTPLNVYIAYYASQRGGLHAHSPQLCIPGGGWNIMRQSIAAMPWRDGQSIDVNRVLIEKKGVRQIVYYWFEERGRHIATESSLKYYALRDALVDNRSDGALVRIVVPLDADMDDAAADLLAGQLTADSSSLLQLYVPAQSQR